MIGRPMVLGVLLAVVGWAAGREARAQVVVVASGSLMVEGRAVARLTGVALQRVDWTPGRFIDVTIAFGGMRAAGALDRDEAALEVRVDRPMAVDVASAFRVVVRAGARLPLYAHERGRTYLALTAIGLPGIQGLSTFREGAAALLAGPAVWPTALPSRLRAVGDAMSETAPAGQSCDALTVHGRPDARSESLTTESYQVIHVTGRRGPWTELWIEHPTALVQAWTRALTGCEPAGRGGLGLSGSGGGGFAPPTPVTLPRGLRFGATERSRAAWLFVGADTPALRYLEDDGPHYRVDRGPDGGELSFVGTVHGPRLRYADEAH